MHAAGYDKEYIEEAIANGLDTLGFSDHAPYVYPDGYVSYYKMVPDELPEYVSALSHLREIYRGKIDIHIGLEAEYYPPIFDKALELWRENKIEYLILGQHYINEEWGSAPLHSFAPLGDEELVLYTDLCIEALHTGYFSAVAHPDLLNYNGGSSELYAREARRLIKAAIETDTPLEYNLLGLRGGRHYPNPSFWREAAKLSPKVILGCDAHEPESVAYPENVKMALADLKGYGLTPITELTLKSIY